MSKKPGAEIVHTLTKDKSPSPAPFFLLVGGGMQTGQGSFLSMLTEEKFVDKANTVVITPSAFLSMPGFEEIKNIQHPEKLPHMIGLYQEIVKETVRTAIKNGASVALVDHGEDPAFIKALHEMCKNAGYQTLLAGMFSSAESYYDYANCTEEFFGRKADHARGFLFLRAFSKNFDDYASLFDSASLFESRFSRTGNVPALAMQKVAEFSAENSPAIYDPSAIERFQRNRLLDPAVKTPKEAVRLFPQEEKTAADISQPAPKTAKESNGLTAQFNALCGNGLLSDRIQKQFGKIMVKPIQAASDAPDRMRR